MKRAGNLPEPDPKRVMVRLVDELFVKIFSMDKNIDNAQVQLEACEAIEKLALKDDMYSSVFVKRNKHVSILNAMDRYKNNVQLLLAACSALSILARNVNDKVIIKSANVFSQIITIMRVNNSNVQLQVALFNTIYNIYTTDSGKIMTWDSFMTVMNNHLDNKHVQEAALFLYYVLLTKNESTRSMFMRKNAHISILRAMDKYTDDVNLQFRCCIIIQNLVHNNEAELINANVHISILRAMDRHIDCEQLQKVSCELMKELAKNNKVELINANVHISILRAMDRYVSNARLQIAACFIMVELAIDNSHFKEDLKKANITAYILRAMYIHRNDVHLQIAACRAIENLTSINVIMDVFTVRFNGPINVIKEDVATSIVRAMDIHKTDVSIQIAACMAINNFSIQNKMNTNVYMSVLRAMGQHIDNLELQIVACKILKRIPLEYKADLLKANVISYILNTMKKHKHDPSLQETAKSILEEYEAASLLLDISRSN